MSKKFSVLFDDEDDQPVENVSGNIADEHDQCAAASEENGDAPPAVADEPDAEEKEVKGSSNASSGQQQEAKQQNEPAATASNKEDKKELLVCAGAMCTCDKAVAPAPVKLNVLSQHDYYINDADGSQKLIATDKEQDITALNFVSCKFPDPSKPKPCNAKLLWKDFYKHIQLPGGAHPLTEKSTATCTVGTGKVEIKMHGQQSQVTPQDVKNAGSPAWAGISPVVSEADVEILEADKDDKDEKGVGVITVRAKNEGPYPVGATIPFEAAKLTKQKEKCTQAELQGINWIAYDNKGMPIVQQTDIGSDTTIHFAKAGSYTVEAYGNTADANSANGKKKKQAATTIITIEENRISGVKHAGSNPYRYSEPAIFSIGTLFPVGTIPLPGGATTAATSWQVIKKSGEGIPALSATTGASVVVTCTGVCDYAVIATLSGKAQQSEAMHAIKNRVTHVKADKEGCRPGDTVSYTAEFRLVPTPLELAQLKWKCVDAHGGEHPKTLAAGSPTQNSIYGHAGHYKVYAYFHAPAKEAMAEVEVVQPSLEACYWRGMDGELKTITDWEEKTEISMSFKACDGLSVQVEIYVLKKEDRARILLATTEAHKIGSSNYLRVPFTTKRAAYKGKLSEGDELLFKIKGSGNKWKIEDENTEQPRQHLKFSSKEKLAGIAFYKDGKRVTQAAYGDTLKCRVYGRNLSSGKDGAEVKIYRVEKRLGKDALRADTEMVRKDRIVIDERGYGEFDFTLDVAEGKKYDDPIHYFRAWIEENEVFGEQELSVGGANSTMLFAMKPTKEARDGTSMVGIEKKEDEGIINSCGGKYCIKKEDSSELIREINIRLAGFGGNVPTDKFTDRTEKMVKQFQRDYMKVPETGKICGNVLRAIDEFCAKWTEKISDYTCLCKGVPSITDKCTGFGKGRYKDQYNSSQRKERFHKYERPGVHRTLLWGTSALKYYISTQAVYKYRHITAGYRCWDHNRSVPRTSTNHMGKAVDIQFFKNNKPIEGINALNLPILNDIYNKFYKKYLDAKYQWAGGQNNFCIEPIGTGGGQTYSWIHLDIREFDNAYLDDKYFVKTQDLIRGKSIIELAKELGHLNTCNCLVVALPKQSVALTNCTICTVLETPRKSFYEEFGTAAIKMVEGKGKSNKFKGLYMVAQRRQENSFNLRVPNNNPMNIKGNGDLGSSKLSTHEYINAKKVYMDDGFANFSTVEKGFEGYLALLDKNYKTAYNAILDDSKSIDDFLSGMQDHGRLGAYATDPNYKISIKNIFNGVVRDYKK